MTWHDSIIGSFFYTNAGRWYDATGVLGFDWDFTDPETGEKVPEGNRLRFTALCAPEYCVNKDGSVIWDELGDGVSMSMEFTVDNTAPKLVGECPLTLSADGNTLYYTAQDENYIAAVILLNGSATKAIYYSYPDMPVEQKGQAFSGALNLTDYREEFGNKAVVAVCDYAGNEAYYAINLNGSGNSYGSLLAYQYAPKSPFGGGVNTWVSFDPNVSNTENHIFTADADFVCAEYVGGYVFAQTKDGSLYGIPYADFLEDRVDLDGTFITRLENVYHPYPGSTLLLGRD